MARRVGTASRMTAKASVPVGYVLGTRNRETLPGFGMGNESIEDNRVKSKVWRQHRKVIASIAATGMKYV